MLLLSRPVSWWLHRVVGQAVIAISLGHPISSSRKQLHRNHHHAPWLHLTTISQGHMCCTCVSLPLFNHSPGHDISSRFSYITQQELRML
ncbi:hypothetical protein B0T21DRAFT_144440 [Apiosordaria backusii]|uniref:Uncharacterized protein n=1 Tax=Apiosordaria backusii TaxID=314023 RepID=A0AA40BSN4_9PEZI|nr:hypothetical protein B0T21DRAFT_144440 [Apiosordaria backusii]